MSTPFPLTPEQIRTLPRGQKVVFEYEAPIGADEKNVVDMQEIRKINEYTYTAEQVKAFQESGVQPPSL